jgi:hypothetical protein
LWQIKLETLALWHGSLAMICCLIAALLLSPVSLWAIPRLRKPVGPDGCTQNRRLTQVVSLGLLVVAGLCLAMFLLAWFQPVPFRHICSVFQRA